MDAGQLRDVITLQRPTWTRESGYNSKQKTYVDVVRGGVRGRAKDVTDDNSETNVGQRRTNTRKREVLIRWIPNVATSWRLRVNAETRTRNDGEEEPLYFEIVSLAEVGYRDGIRLMCEEYKS